MTFATLTNCPVQHGYTQRSVGGEPGRTGVPSGKGDRNEERMVAVAFIESLLSPGTVKIWSYLLNLHSESISVLWR